MGTLTISGQLGRTQLGGFQLAAPPETGAYPGVDIGVFIQPVYNSAPGPSGVYGALDDPIGANNIDLELLGYGPNSWQPQSWTWWPALLHWFYNIKGYCATVPTSGGTPMLTDGVRYISFDDTPGLPIATVTTNGTTATINFGSQDHSFYVGQHVLVAATGVAAVLNGTVQVTAATATSVSFASTVTGVSGAQTGTVAAGAAWWNGTGFTAWANITDTTGLNTRNLGPRRFADYCRNLYTANSVTPPVILLTVRTGAINSSHNMEDDCSWQQNSTLPGAATWPVPYDEFDPQNFLAGVHDGYLQAFASQLGDYLYAYQTQVFHIRINQECNGNDYLWAYNNQFVEPTNAIATTAAPSNGPMLMNALVQTTTVGNPIAATGGSAAALGYTDPNGNSYGGYGLYAAMYRHIRILMHNTIISQLVHAHGMTTEAAAALANNVQFVWCVGSGSLITPTSKSAIANPAWPQIPHSFNEPAPITAVSTTTIGTLSNGLTLPQTTIYATTVGTPTSGTLYVTTSAGVQTVTYTGTGTAGGHQYFSGCSGGTGTMTTGGLITTGATTVITATEADIPASTSYVLVAGAGGATSLNGVWEVIAATTSTLTIGVAANADWTSGGTVTPALPITQIEANGATAVITVTPGSDYVSNYSNSYSLVGHGWPVGSVVTVGGTGLMDGNYTVTEITNTTLTVASTLAAGTYGPSGSTWWTTLDGLTTYTSNAAPWAAFYPGDDVVDIPSIDGYNSAKSNSTWKNFWNQLTYSGVAIFPACYEAFTGPAGNNGFIGGTKPIQISETGCPAGSTTALGVSYPDTSQPDWIKINLLTAGGSSQLSANMPRVKSLLWLDSIGHAQAGTGYSLRASDQALAQWQAIGTDPGWNTLGAIPQYPPPYPGNTDTATAADSPARKIARTRPAADTATAADTAARTTTGPRTTADGAVAADALARAQTGARTNADNATAADTVARTGAQTRTGTDNAVAADSQAATGTRARATADTATAADGQTIAGTRARAIADTATAADALARQPYLPRLIADASTAADTVARAAYLTHLAGDTATSEDFTGVTSAKQKPLFDNAVAADTQTAAGTRARSAADNAVAADTLGRQIARPRPATDNAVAADSQAATGTRARPAADQATAVDSQTARTAKTRPAADQAVAADALAGNISLGVPAADQAAAVDALAGQTSTYPAVADQAPTVDLVGQYFFTAVAADSATAADSLVAFPPFVPFLPTPQDRSRNPVTETPQDRSSDLVAVAAQDRSRHVEYLA